MDSPNNTSVPVERDSRADIPRFVGFLPRGVSQLTCSSCNDQRKTAEEVKIGRDETLLNVDYNRKNRAEGPTGSAEIPTFIEVFDEDSGSSARIQAGHVDLQYRPDRNSEPLQKENREVILEVLPGSLETISGYGRPRQATIRAGGESCS